MPKTTVQTPAALNIIVPMAAKPDPHSIADTAPKPSHRYIEAAACALRRLAGNSSFASIQSMQCEQILNVHDLVLVLITRFPVTRVWLNSHFIFAEAEQQLQQIAGILSCRALN